MRKGTTRPNLSLLFLVWVVPSVTPFPTNLSPRARTDTFIVHAASKQNDSQSSGWDNFKRMIYDSVDGTNQLVEKARGADKDTNNQVTDGYSSFEQSLRGVSPGKKLMNAYQSGAASRAEAPTPVEKKKRDGFAAFKESLYNAADAFKGDEEDVLTPLQKLSLSKSNNGEIPFKRSMAQELGNEDLLSSNPIKRFKAEQEIRDREARQRAETRNELMRARKEDLYKIVDAFQEAVNAVPDILDETTKTVTKVSKSLQQVPQAVGKVASDVQAVPCKVQNTAQSTQKSIENAIGTTKKIVNDVVDAPNKIKRKAAETQKSIVETKGNVEDGITKVKVLLRLEKPKPKPPKLAPPTPRTGKQLAQDVAGGVAKGAGQVAWWGAKSTANLVWKGAKIAFEKGKESLSKDAGAVQTQPPPTRPTTSTNAADVEQEVADALRLAEASLKKASEDD